MARKVKSKEKRANSEILAHADMKMLRILEAEELIASDTKAMLIEIEGVKQKWDRIGYWTRIVEGLNKDLVALMKKNSEAIFEGEERVELGHGSLLFTIEERVVKARGVLEKLKEQKFTGAIKVVESVDWDALEKWPVERLVLVGTKRKREEIFSWELKAKDKGNLHLI